MAKSGLLIDYTLCTGCHSCEVSCLNEHHFARGTWGIRITDEKPFQIDEKTWEFKFVPIPSQLCDLCADRVNAGKDPACVHNCQARVMEYGSISDLAKKAEEMDRRSVLFVL